MKGPAALAVVIVVVDQVTKLWALRALVPGASVRIIDGFFSLTLVMNPGLAFGMLAGVPEGFRWTVGLLSVIALMVLAGVAARMLPQGGRLSPLAIGLIFGGAIGNLIDRFRFGAVVDFLDFYWRGWHWPAFNVADSAISVGVALLALQMILADRAASRA